MTRTLYTNNSTHPNKQFPYSKSATPNLPSMLTTSTATKIKRYTYNVFVLILIGFILRKAITLLHLPTKNKGPRLSNSNIIGKVLERTRHSYSLSCLYTLILGLGYHLLDLYYDEYPKLYLSFSNLLRCFGAFLGANYLIFKIEFATIHHSAIVSISLIFLSWLIFDRSLHGLMFSSTACLVASWIIYVSNLDLVIAANLNEQINLLVHLPMLFFFYCILAGSIGRVLFRAKQPKKT